MASTTSVTPRSRMVSCRPLIALTPLIAIQIMGVVYRIKTEKLEKNIEQISVPEFSDDIIDLEEE